MTHLFLLHATEDQTCATRIRQNLNVRGYAVDDEIQTFDVSKMLYKPSAKSALVASAAVILLWSSNAARNERIWNAVRFAQQLKRPILPVTLDSTAFPETLPGAVPTLAQLPCDNIAASLASSLPPAQSNDPLFALYEQAVDMSQPARIEMIERAATMLQSSQYRSGQGHDALLALLNCLAKDEPITSVREKAQETMNSVTSSVPLATPRPAQSSLFQATCPDGHVCEYDKREECKKDTVLRGSQYLTCKTCGKMFYYPVDCRGYL